jgi:membrane protease YdiL (CAAX protease family)
VPAPWKRFALPASVLLIVSSWAFSTWAQLLRSEGPGTLPGSAAALAVSVSVKTAIVVAIVWAFLRANDEHIRDLGITGPSLKTALVWGPLLAAGVFVFVNVVLGSALKALGTPSRPQALPGLFRDPREAPLWVYVAVVGGGFTEELVRAFVLTRFDRALGRAGLAAALVVDTVVFGLGHLYQGVTGAIQAGTTGLLFALIFLRRRRAADAMVVHALFDLFGVALAYFLYAGKG